MRDVRITITLDNKFAKELKKEWAKQILDNPSNDISFSKFIEILLKYGIILTDREIEKEITKEYKKEKNNGVTKADIYKKFIKLGIRAKKEGFLFY